MKISSIANKLINYKTCYSYVVQLNVYYREIVEHSMTPLYTTEPKILNELLRETENKTMGIEMKIW